MMKLLFKPTGNIFTLPDSEALKIKETDRGNYEILDAGLNNSEKPESLTKEEVETILEEKAQRLAKEQELKKVKEEKALKAKTRRKNPNFKVSDTNLDTMPKVDMEVLAEKLGIRDTHNIRKPQLRKMIKDMIGEQ